MSGTIARILALALAAGSARAAVTFNSLTGGTIPDNSFSTVDIIINDPSTLLAAGNNVTVSITGLSGIGGNINQAVGDLIATLTFTPANLGPVISVDLFNRPGVQNPGDSGFLASFNDNYTFNSGGSGDLWAIASGLGAADPIPGDPTVYFTTTALGTPTNLSSAFNGLAIAGTWSLTMSDNFDDGGQDQGSYIQWSLSVETSAVPEPSYTGLIGGALGLGLLRRRIAK